MDLAGQLRDLHAEVEAAIRRTIDSTDFILGRELSEFEGEFADYCGCKYAIGVSSGTAALHLALLALGVGPGDEVITVPNTFVATVEAILYTGATPVFADADERTYCISPDAVANAITPRTKVLLPVHLYGQPCDMESIMGLAAKHGISVVEDACQAHGASFMGKKTGTFGAAAAFSFYPTKNLGALGDAGAVTTNDEGLAKKIKALRHHAQYEPNVFPELGYNCRLDSVQAAVLRVKLKHLDRWNERRRAIAQKYREKVRGEEYSFQETVPGSEPVYHIMAIRHPRRRLVQDLLNNAGIGWGRHIVPPIHKQPGYGHLVRNGEKFPVSETLSEELVSLPVFPELTDAQVEYVAEALGKIKVSV